MVSQPYLSSNQTTGNMSHDSSTVFLLKSLFKYFLKGSLWSLVFVTVSHVLWRKWTHTSDQWKLHLNLLIIQTVTNTQTGSEACSRFYTVQNTQSTTNKTKVSSLEEFFFFSSKSKMSATMLVCIRRACSSDPPRPNTPTKLQRTKHLVEARKCPNPKG